MKFREYFQSVHQIAGFFAFLSAALPITASAAPAVIQSLAFEGKGSESHLEIRSNQPVTFTQRANQENQLVIEIPDAKLGTAAKANRLLDTSSMDSKVLLVSPSQNGSKVQLVIQLRQGADPASVQVAQEGNVLKVNVPNEGSSSPVASSGTDAVPVPGDAPPAPLVQPATEEQVSVGDTIPPKGDSASAAPASPEPKTALDQFAQNQDTHRFSGKPITIQVRDADLADVFRLIGEASGFNILVGDDVKGKVTLSLQDVPWDQALDIILRSQRLGAERNNNILRVVTLTNLTQEKQQELQAKLASEASAPRVTRVFPINYANPADLQQILTKFGTTSTAAAAGAASGSGGGAAGANPGNQAIVQVDTRTNSIVVRDIPENIERMKKLVEILDTQTPQVLIEAKVIEATEGFSKSINGSVGMSNNKNNQFFASANGSNPVDPLLGTGGLTGSQISASSGSPSAGGAFGLSPSLGILPGIQRLNALLNISESESAVKVVASPKTVVLNKESASILQSTPVLIPGVTTLANGIQTTTTSIDQANLSLTVTPTVTNEGSVLMTLNVARDIPFPLSQQSNGVAKRNLSTKVLVESGSTLVMGGVYVLDSKYGAGGFPILRKIPILGALFGSETESTNRTELFFFITPRILNTREAGLTS